MSSPTEPADDYNVADDDQKEVLDDEPRSILMGIISQLSKGTDLHRVTLPTFVLEPRSMLERITDFMCHPDLIMGTHAKEDPVERFVDVVRYFVSGWHIRPKGVKKPYNPVLGEHFRCQYKYADGTNAFFVAEQTSHHPPVSNYLFCSPENHLMVQGEVKPKSKFLGNSAATLMTGETRITFTDRDEEYILNLPNVYARGLLFGTMILELGDNVTIKCPKTDLVCELEFKVKGYFTGSYNALGGKIKRISKRDTLYELSGKWSDKSFIKPAKGDTAVLFSAEDEHIHPKLVAPEAEQEQYESRRLWSKVTAAIADRDLDTATDEKTKIEARQRANRIAREERGDAWSPRFFEQVGDDPESFEFKLLRTLPKDPKLRRDTLNEFIFTNPPPHPYGDEPAS
ncbi:Oxysterol-binding protein OBPa [Blastocladiella emersonii ATCC 22665]|nr:Oxysterol-binding protein OBPa [Blastocladiella emersonii ATCC 22665]